MPPRERFTERLNVKLSPAQKAYLRRQARKKRSVGAVIRDMINEARGVPAVSGGAG